MYSWQITNQENDQWIPQEGPTINPVPPTFFDFSQLKDGLEIVCGGPKYAGALVKNVAPLLYPTPTMKATYQIWFSTSLLQNAQVIEIDRKITDSAGWTYDGSFQFNIASGWMTQVNDPWVNTGVLKQLQPFMWNPVEVDYQFDYVNHTIRVNGLAAIPARQIGWTPSEIVTQIQLCTGANGGFYTCKFAQIGISGE